MSKADGETTAPLLSVKDLRVTFGSAKRPVHAVRGVSFDVRPGETLGLVGESGSGKTTVGRAVLRLLPASAEVTGEVSFHGEPLLELRGPSLKAFRRSAQIVFQDPAGSLNPRLRVRTIVGEAMRVHGLVRTPKEMEDRVAELLEQVGLTAGAMNRFPHEFSGGQRQRIGIARALALEPRFIVCDEPTSALDVSVQAQILNLLADLRQQHNLSYLFISHDMAVVNHLCDRVAVMKDGELVEVGTREQVINEPKQAYTKALLGAVPRVR
ncbi:MAG: ATP-binding cassette domain-containing protein [Phycisphaerales bacterium]